MSNKIFSQLEIENILDDIYYIIYSIKDPEFPQTLSDLKVIERENIKFK